MSEPVSEDSGDERAASQNLLLTYLALFSEQRWDAWIELWAEDGVLEFPFAPPGRRQRYAGKAEILAYMKPLGGRIAGGELDYFNIHPMLDPKTVCLEMSVKGRIAATDAPYNQKYISIVQTRAGKITLYREYWNPIVSMDANGGREAWTAAFGSPEPAAEAT